MDSPSQRQPRLANADAPASEIQAFPHGSSSMVQEITSPVLPDLEKERPMRLASSAQSMERRGVVAPSDGLIPASVMMPRSNVRSDGLIPDVSQPRRDFAQCRMCPIWSERLDRIEELAGELKSLQRNELELLQRWVGRKVGDVV